MLHGLAKRSVYAECMKRICQKCNRNLPSCLVLQVRKLWSSATQGYVQALQGIQEAIALAARSNATQTVVIACSCMHID